MNRLAVLALAFAAALPCHAEQVAADFQVETVPLYVWGIVAVLGLVWVIVLLPRRPPPRREPAIPDLLPGHGPPSTPHAAAPAPAARPRMPAAATSAAPTRPAPAPASPARPTAWSLESIAGLEGRRFEGFVQGLWQVNGYRAELSGKSADGGAEIRIHSAASGRLFAVAHCRPARSGALGADSVGGLWDMVQSQAAALGIFYGLGGFTAEAVAFAQGKRLKLLNAAELLAQIGGLRPEQQKALLEHVWRHG